MAVVNNSKLTESLLLHSDRGFSFTSKAYHKFLQKNSFLQGSMSAKSTPTDNSIIERTFRTFKNQLKVHPLPETVSSLNEIIKMQLKTKLIIIIKSSKLQEL